MGRTIATITIDRLRLYCHHGVLAQERAVGNEFDVTAVMEYDAAEAVKSDDIAQALNYAEAVRVISDTMQTPSALLEHAAGRVIDALASAFPSLLKVTVSITKIAPPISAQMRGITVTISRHIG